MVWLKNLGRNKKIQEEPKLNCKYCKSPMGKTIRHKLFFERKCSNLFCFGRIAGNCFIGCGWYKYSPVLNFFNKF